MSDPARLREWIFADPNSMLAKMLTPPLEQMPEPLLLLQLKAAEAAARVAWRPYLHNPKLRGRLHLAKVPTLLIWGEQDRLIPLAFGRAWAEALPDARLVVIPECGHYPIFERSEDFARHAVEFLK
jgi:pimeloyl-ACP methyl ester carboxylesterase